MLESKGLKRRRLNGLADAGFNDSLSTTKASAPCVHMGDRRDDFIKGICSPGSLGPTHGRIWLDSAALMLHSHEMEMSSLTFQM